MGEGKIAAASFVQLGTLKDQAHPAPAFQWFERAYNLDPMNLQAVLQYGRGLFSRNSVGMH